MAKWTKSEEEEDLYICSECKSSFYSWVQDSNIEEMTKSFPTCPRCQANMKETIKENK